MAGLTALTIPRTGRFDAVRLRLLKACRLIGHVTRRSLLPAPTAFEAKVIKDLRTEGVHVTSLDVLFPDASPSLFGAVNEVAALLDGGPKPEVRSWFKAGYSSLDMAASELVARFPDLYLLGLQKSILSLAEQYLQAPVAYHGAVVRHSPIGGAQIGTRRWHHDAEDFHVLRMVVYLNDVLTTGAGPFEYIPLSEGVHHKDFASRAGTYSDEEMTAVVKPERWKQVMGKAGTVIFCDTATVFHHESFQTERSRSVVMIGFATRLPKNMPLSMSHFPVESLKDKLLEIVPRALHPYVAGWRRSAI